MYVCKCWFDIHLLEEPNSLKRKRQIIKSLKDRIWNKFRVSVAEVGENDLWQKAEIGIAFVSSTGIIAEQIFSKILNLIDSEEEVEIVDMFYDIEKIKS
ncbi:MAG TPA: DUF503 domain-containing protein [Candidatus Eremiobacteraeota bacterium]|nr:MAG: hypothetical protein BWY64_00756 [bacterium ADurb.Bin363]HPZ08673.1 DUF503 domain-containing protein [Candidatus Eremiobacteraeota bacterium]